MHCKAFHLHLEEQRIVKKRIQWNVFKIENPKDAEHLERFVIDLYNLIKSLTLNFNIKVSECEKI